MCAQRAVLCCTEMQSLILTPRAYLQGKWRVRFCRVLTLESSRNMGTSGADSLKHVFTGAVIRHSHASIVQCSTPVYLGLVCRSHLALVARHAAREEAKHHRDSRKRNRRGVVAGREATRFRPPLVTDNHDHHQLDRQSKAARKKEGAKTPLKMKGRGTRRGTAVAEERQRERSDVTLTAGAESGTGASRRVSTPTRNTLFLTGAKRNTPSTTYKALELSNTKPSKVHTLSHPGTT